MMTSLTRAALLLFTCFTSEVQASAEKQAEKPRVELEFRRAETKPSEGLTELTVPDTNDKIYVHKLADATNRDIAEARVVDDDGRGKPAIEIKFTKEGAKKMAKLSEQQQDKPLAILLDGKLISAPVVRAQFSERALITGAFTKEQVKDLVNNINGR
jgi:preprotein translocase subunit SecD